MLMIDTRRMTARITIQDILKVGKQWASNPVALGAFMLGVKLPADTLLDPRWRLPASLSGQRGFYDAVVGDLVPSAYDVRHLDTLGGRFALRLIGGGDYTVIAMNRRVVTLPGLPIEEATGQPVIDTEMRADVFTAVCNELLFNLAESMVKAFDARKPPAREEAVSTQC